MKSISGFNNSSLQGSSDSFLVNKIGAGVDIAKTAMSNDVQFQTSTGGTSYVIPNSMYGNGYTYNQFDCLVQKWKDPEHPESEPEYRLRCVVGLTSFENYNVDDKGFITNENFIWNHRLVLWNVWPTGTSFIDDNDNSQTFLDNGYILLEKNKNYKVFIYKINPSRSDWKESLSPQIAIIEEGSAADTEVIQKYNGGGSMQAYIVVKNANNIVTADPADGKIANFNASLLNDHITFHADEIVLDRNSANFGIYPTDMVSWLNDFKGNGSVPVFAKPSPNPKGSNFDTTMEMTISYVPYGPNWKGWGVGSGIGAVIQNDTSNYGYYWTETDTFNWWASNVLQAKDFIKEPEKTEFYLSGAFDTDDLKIILGDSGGPDPYHVVYFDEINHNLIPIIANSQTSVTKSVEVPTGKPVGNVGFKYFDCARKEIAYIKWKPNDPAHPELAGKFDIYQINNGPINFNYKPIMLDIKKIENQADAHWDTDKDDWVNPSIVDIGEWGDYTDALSELKYRENSSDIGGFLPVKPTRSSG